MNAAAPDANTAPGTTVGANGSLAGFSPAEITRNAALPPRLTSLVLAVTGKRGFWKRERAEIARELCGHFLDGLESGRTPDQLAANFGEPGRTARLMLRAKRRNRPLAWRAAMMSVRATFIFFCSIILVYGLLAARFWSGSPTLARNYMKEFNAPIAAIPLADRAWPEYRAVRMALGVRGEVESALLADGLDEPAEGQGDVRFKATGAQRVAFLRSIRPLLDRVRAASQRPALGYVAATTTSDVDLARATQAGYTPPASADVEPDNPSLVSVLLPALGHARHLVRLLKSDALLAAREGDGERSAESVLAMLGIARQSREFPCLISDLVSVALMEVAASTLGTILESQPGVVADTDLIRLSHAFATFGGGGRFEMSLASEQAMFDDLLQRIYTDDGRGNGRLAPGGVRMLEAFATSEGDSARLNAGGLPGALGPLAMVALADRASQRRAYASLVNAAHDWLATPPWLRGNDVAEDRLEGEYESPVWRARYMPVSIMLPALSRAGWTLERAALVRDAACVVIAIELHKRRTGAYPAKLADVGPRLLPRVPLDPFDGRAIKYTTIGGQPVLFSIGVDRKDDGGRGPLINVGGQANGNGAGEVQRWLSPAQAAELLSRKPSGAGPSVIDGDWVLWPPSRQSRLVD